MRSGGAVGLGLVCVALGGAVPAGAVDQPVAGRRLVLRQGPVEERLVLVARDAVVLPTPGAIDDPTLVGGQLHVGNPETGEWAHLTLSAAGWWPAAPGLYRFRNPATSGAGTDVRTILLREGRGIKVIAARSGITLDEPAQRALAIVLASGTRRWCVLFGGKVKKDVPGHFAARRAAAPSGCPEPYPATSTTTTSRPPTTRFSTTTSTSLSTTSTTSSSSTSSTTTSTLADPSTSTSTTSSTETSTSSTTSTTEAVTCGGIFPLCSGTCEDGKTCGGLFCTCE